MRINALIIMGGLVAVMTMVVIGVAKFGEVRVQSMPVLVPIVPAKNATTALDVVIPTSELIIKNDLVERPMFWKERRPYVPPVKVKEKEVIVEEDPGPDPFEQITLMGAYSGGVMLKVEGVVQRIRIGEAVGETGWTLEAVEQSDVVFARGNEEKVLGLEHATVKPPKQARRIPNKTSKVKRDKGKAKEKTERKSRAELGKSLK